MILPTNLILLRQAYESKNVPWMEYKSTLDRLILEGKLKLNPDQENQTRYLDEPPLDDLGVLLHHINLIGK